MANFILIKDTVKNIRRFSTRGRHMEFNLKSVPVDSNPIKWFKDGIKEIIDYGINDLQPNDMVGITFCGQNFTRGRGWMNFKPASEIKWNDIWEIMSKIFQSNSEGVSTDTFCLGITSVRLPVGKGRPTKYINYTEECSRRRGIIFISNKDNLCLPRALVVAMAYMNKDSEYRKVRRDIGKIQTTRTKKLLDETGITIPREGAGIPELRLFQDFLSNYRICVYLYGCKGREVLFEGPAAKPSLNLLYHDGHFNVITSLTAAFSCNFYCTECHIPYEHTNEHRCRGTCPCCQSVDACDRTHPRSCNNCYREFRSEECFENHKNICDSVKKCLTCLKTYNLKQRRNQLHMCGEIFCKICGSFKQAGHFCYIRQDKKKPRTDNMLFVFFDLETRQEKFLTASSQIHEPNLCVFEQCCSSCIAEENLQACDECGIRQQILNSNICIEGFICYLLEARKKFKNVVAIAHNGQAFDVQFILNNILKNKFNIKPELIMRGTKILLLQLDNIKFIDSLNYFPMPLSALPKAFGISGAKKGYFPYLFNTTANQNYVGPLPAPKYYTPDSMKPEERIKFLKWHEETMARGYIFDMQKDLIEYCVNDVEILKQACLKFRNMFIEECNVDPFIESITIASACNLVFRRNFLEKNTIGIIPRNGYRLCDNQSKIALQWLIWEEEKRGIKIQHAVNGKEAVIHGMKVDGYCDETREIFEFQGCYHHGCPMCYPINRDNPLHDDHSDTMNQRYEKTKAKCERLKNLNYEIVEMWECQFRRKQLNYLDKHPLLDLLPLNPRDAFYGGRTEALKLRRTVEKDEKIRYIDYCSLYPWVCKYGKFPVGHPDVYVGNEACSQLNLNETEGLIKCKILPPQDLYHPVLPVKMHNKLLFSLCRTCSELQNTGECTHNEDERCLSGTWVLDELRKALEKGYKLVTVMEIWRYKVVQLNEITEGLFTKFINKFLKIKQQASGWPSKCTTRAERDAYIQNYLNKEDIQLEFDEIVNNPGLRSMAKLILNSFWGKFGQRENQPHTQIVSKPGALYALLTNPSINVCHIEPVNEETIIVNWEYKEEAADSLSTVNVTVASFTTAQARLKLYEEMDRLGERVLYVDTDSIIYVSKPGDYEPPTGSFLGEFTDELEMYGPCSYIVHFISGGPKSYAYRVYCPGTQTYTNVCKFKGITLNYKNLQLLNFNVLEKLLFTKDNDDDEQCILLSGDNIRCTPAHEIVTCTETKTFKINFTKRKRVGKSYDSLPYGYKRLRLE